MVVGEGKGSSFRPEIKKEVAAFRFPFFSYLFPFDCKKPYIFQKADSITRKNKAALFAFGGPPPFFFTSEGSLFSITWGNSPPFPRFHLHHRPKRVSLGATRTILAIPNTGRFLLKRCSTSRILFSSKKLKAEPSQGCLPLVGGRFFCLGNALNGAPRKWLAG